jgi:GGDEF domain-containing protein
MNVAHPATTGKPGPAPAADAMQVIVPDRTLTLVVEGAAMNVTEVEPESYKRFRSKVSTLAMQMPDHLPEADKLAYIRGIVKEFEGYRNTTDATLRDRQIGWRGLTLNLMKELFASLGVDAASPEAFPLVDEIPRLTTVEDIDKFGRWLSEFLRPASGGKGAATGVSAALRAADRTTSNDNSAGLRGGGAAVEHVRRLKEHGGRGFVAIFRLSFLDVISDRFGMEAVQDCIMAVSAYLNQSLRSNDAIYHWSDASLMGVLENRASQHIATAELNRIVAQNREITITISGRAVMVRIPIEFELISLDQLKDADDLNRISGQQAVQW